MKERPILFNGDMVRAILEGRKTQTRRVIPEKTVDAYYEYDEYCKAVMPLDIPCSRDYEEEFFLFRCPFGQPGDRLWVRETFFAEYENGVYTYRADNPDYLNLLPALGWTPSIHMPREASRITLEVTSIRVERLQNITEEDARAEGLEVATERIVKFGRGMRVIPARDQFAALWDSIYAKRPGQSWVENPWVWAVEFELLSDKRADHA